MSISAASSSYVSSAAETDDDQSFSDMQVSQLQAEILQQSKDIEAFIKNSRKDDDSASLTVLKSLFVLFKSELSVNLKLRKLLVDERKKKSQCEVELKSFFHAVHKIGYQNINDLSTIVECLNEQDNQITNLLKSARQLKEEKANSKKLILQISEMQKQQTMQLQSDNDKDKQMKMIEQELDMCKKNIEVLNMEVNEKTNKLRILEKNNQQLINENLYMKKMFEQDKVSKQNQNDETKTFFMNQIQTLQKNIQTLSNTLKQKEIEHQKALTELNAQNLIDIQSVKTEMNNTISSINREKEDLEENHKKEVERLMTQITNMNKEVSDNAKESEISKVELKVLQNKIDEFEIEKKELIQENNDLKKKFKKLIKKFKKIQYAVNDTEKAYKKQIESIHQDYNEKMRNSISNAEADWENKLSKAENRIKQLQCSIEEQKTEANTLREIIRKLSFNLQQEEAENARLKASFQMHQYSCPPNFRNSMKNIRENQKHDYSSPSEDVSFQAL